MRSLLIIASRISSSAALLTAVREIIFLVSLCLPCDQRCGMRNPSFPLPFGELRTTPDGKNQVEPGKPEMRIAVPEDHQLQPRGVIPEVIDRHGPERKRLLIKILHRCSGGIRQPAVVLLSNSELAICVLQQKPLVWQIIDIE